MKNKINFDENLLNKIKNINDNIARIPGCFAQLYQLCKEYKEGEKVNIFKEFSKIQNKVFIIDKIIKSECKYILDLYN